MQTMQTMDSLDRSLDFLARTPDVLRTLLDGLEDSWVRADEGPETFSSFDVVGHLIHGEDDDWVPRIEHLLEHGERVPFVPFDRQGMRAKYERRPLRELFQLFAERRGASLARLRALALTPTDLARRGRHPDLGSVTLGELLSTWV